MITGYREQLSIVTQRCTDLEKESVGSKKRMDRMEMDIRIQRDTMKTLEKNVNDGTVEVPRNSDSPTAHQPQSAPLSSNVLDEKNNSIDRIAVDVSMTGNSQPQPVPTQSSTQSIAITVRNVYIRISGMKHTPNRLLNLQRVEAYLYKHGLLKEHEKFQILYNPPTESYIVMFTNGQMYCPKMGTVEFSTS